jgi:hypothetical protein
MAQAFRLRVTIDADHTIHLPVEVPPGEAELIVFVPAEASRALQIEARRRIFGRLSGQAKIAQDFDAALPASILGDFEGGGTE